MEKVSQPCMRLLVGLIIEMMKMHRYKFHQENGQYLCSFCGYFCRILFFLLLSFQMWIPGRNPYQNPLVYQISILRSLVQRAQAFYRIKCSFFLFFIQEQSESVEKEKVDTQSDTYSLKVLLFFYSQHRSLAIKLIISHLWLKGQLLL